MDKRVYKPLGRLSRILSEEGNRLAILLALLSFGGLILLIVGILAPQGEGKTGFLVVGGTIFGAGFAAFLAFLTSQYSVLEGYRKEANLDRKEKLYGPLQMELQYLRECLEDAQGGDKPYPRWIDVGQPQPNQTYPAGFEIVSLLQWPKCLASHRKDDFTPRAHKLLNDVLDAATAYNEAILVARPEIEAALQQAIQSEVAKVKNDPSYQDFVTRFHQQIQGSYVTAEMIDTDEHIIFTFVAMGFSRSARPVEDWAHGWLEALSAQQPATLGWLLANQAEKAAYCVRDGIQWSQPSGVAPAPWFESIFTIACEQLQNDATVKAVYTAAMDLVDHLKIAEGAIAQALQYIRERYQGGEPPL